MSNIRTPRSARVRREHFMTVKGVRFTMVRKKRPGEKTMSPGEAMAQMLEVLRSKRK